MQQYTHQDLCDICNDLSTLKATIKQYENRFLYDDERRAYIAVREALKLTECKFREIMEVLQPRLFE